ncbi:MAG: hypothetical protein QNK18_18430 [Gammaproteobacteria bacterium]|nr:hypothetical protein [Gammaproteobacteria bacterium]
MEYTISVREKKWQRNLPYQLWRVMVLSVRFMKLTRLGDVQRVSPQQGHAGETLSAAPR